jgi:hypothetical protein
VTRAAALAALLGGCAPPPSTTLASRAVPLAALAPGAATVPRGANGRAPRDDCCEGPAADAVRDALALNRGGAWWDADADPPFLWVQPWPRTPTDAAQANAEYRRAVADAAHAWRDVAPGLRFAWAADSARASVRVVWRATLPSDAALPTAGRTTLAFTHDGRSVAALVELAVGPSPSARWTPSDVRVVAQHELGHVLGLAHHARASSIMAGAPVAGRPSALDRAALRALYAVRRGSVGGR